MRKIMSFIKPLFFHLVLTGLISFAFAEDSLNTTTRKTVKVGYYENEAFQEGASEKAVKSGYSYEYLQKVSSLTGWQYEYVYGSWTDLYNAFVQGKIDLLAGLGYSSSRLSSMNYPEFPMGYESYHLYIRSNDNSITLDPQTLRNKKIGTIPGLLYDSLVKWLYRKKTGATIVIFNDVKERDAALESGKIDAFIGESSSVTPKELIKPLEKIDSVNMYLCVAKNRPDLLKELNMALSELDNNNPYYINQLSEKYFHKNAVTAYVSASEQDWLDSHNNTLRIAYMDNFFPYCGTNKNGKPAGILSDTITEAFKRIKSEKPVNITYHPYNTTEDMIQAVHNHEVDVIFPVSNNIYFMEQNDLFQSKEVVTSAMNLVYLNKLSENTTKTIAINRHNQIQYDYAHSFLPESKEIFYESVDECLDAVNKGEAGCAILSGLRASVLLRKSAWSNLKYIELPENTTKCFGVSTYNIGVLSLIDRALNTLNSKDPLSFTYKYIENDTNYSIREFIRRNILLVSFVAIILISVFIIITAVIISKHNKEKLYYRFAYKDSLTGAFNRRAYEEDLTFFESKKYENIVCVSMDLNGLKKVNDESGHIAGDELIKESCRVIKEAFEKYGKIYRTGGDEFYAILRTDKENFSSAKQKLDQLCEAWKGVHSDTLRISVGAAFISEAENKSLMELCKTADNRMYEAKSEHYRKTGLDRRGQNDAHKALCAMYTKILKINITDDSYSIVNMDLNEQTAEKGFSDKISRWLHDFGISGQVHPEDLNAYQEKTSLDYMKEFFKAGRKSLKIFYRRKHENDWRMSMMQIIPAPDYTGNSQSLYLYVNNIDTIDNE